MSEDIANQRKNDIAETLVRRNDFKSKFLVLTGGQTKLNDEMRRISFQDHFIDLNNRSLAIIRRPINT
jgi:hypothetical protein